MFGGCGFKAILLNCNIANMAKEPETPTSSNIVNEEVYEPNVYAFVKPVTPRLISTLMDVESWPKYTMPVENCIILIKAKPSSEEVLEEMAEETSYNVVKRIMWMERESKKPEKKRSWGIKTRNPFRHYLKVNIGFKQAYEVALCVAIAVVKLLGPPCRQAGAGRPPIYDVVKVFAALLVKRLFNLSFEKLSRMLKEYGISLALSGEAYPCASTLYNYYLKINLCYYQLAVLLLYLKVFAKYVAHFRLDCHMGLDSCYVRLDHYVEAFYKGCERLVKARFKFYTWCWLKWNVVAFIAFSKEELLEFSRLIPGGLLLADGEFSDRKFLMALSKRFRLAVNVRFKPWIGFKVEDCYWLRKLVERVFGCFERRRCLYSMFRLPCSIKRDLCLACFAHNVVCLLSVIKCCKLFVRL